MTKPAPTSAIVMNRTGTRRSLRNRRAQALQNLRLVQRCHLRRSSLVPHSEQKFGLYTVRTPSVKPAAAESGLRLQKGSRAFAFLCDTSAFFAVKNYTAKWRKESAELRKETSVRHFRKQLKCCLMRPKVTIVELVLMLLVE